jgi:small basic protein
MDYLNNPQPLWVGCIVVWIVFGMALGYEQPKGYFGNAWTAILDALKGKDVELREVLKPQFGIPHEAFFLGLLFMTILLFGLEIIQRSLGIPLSLVVVQGAGICGGGGVGIFIPLYALYRMFGPPSKPRPKIAKQKKAPKAAPEVA